MEDTEPLNVNEAQKDQVWRNAMKEELATIEKNMTWELMELPRGKKPIDLKWVFNVKKNSNGTNAKHKTRLVARGFLRREGIDFTEVFATVTRLETIRLVTALASFNGWPMLQLDIKFAFLNGPLEEEVFVTQPPGFSLEVGKQMVYKLIKALYGLKQAPRAWNKYIDGFLQRLGFVKSLVEYGVYTLSSDKGVVIICLYVDDLLLSGRNLSQIEEVKWRLMTEF
jgi:hypothetical protein